MTDKLLQPGWAGELDDGELASIMAALRESNRLRTAWGFPAGERRLSEDGVKAVAMFGSPDDPARNSALVRQARRTASADADRRFPAMNENVPAVGGASGRGKAMQRKFAL